MARIESYTAEKIDEKFDLEEQDRTAAITAAIQAETVRADAKYMFSDYTVVRNSGTNTDIQPVLNTAEVSGGGSVTIGKGVWLINSPLLLPSNVELRLSPGAIIRRNAAIDNLIRNKSAGTVGGYTANQDITIDGGEWDGNDASFSGVVSLMAFGHCNNVSIENCEFYGVPTGCEIRLAAVSHGVVRHCTFRDYPGSAEMLQLEGAFSSTVFPWFGPYDSTTCTDILVEGNTFSGAAYGVGSRTSVIARRHSNIRIIGNHFTDITVWAIRLQDYEQVIVNGNTFLNCAIGIHAHTGISQICHGFTISNNIFKSCSNMGSNMDGGTDAGRFLRRISYTGNIVRLCGNYGFYDPYTYLTTYTGNNITECGIIGVRIFSQRQVSFVGNNVTGNNTDEISTGADVKVGDFAAPSANDTMSVSIVGNMIETLYIRTGIEILVAQNQILTSYLKDADATEVYRRDNFINNVFSAT